LSLKFSGVDQTGSIDLLIGADVYYEILQPGRPTFPGNFPVLKETVLGWTISGRTPDTNQIEPQSTYLSREDSLKSNLKRFWEVEVVEQFTMIAEQQASEELTKRIDPIPLIPLPSHKNQITVIQRNSKKGG